MSKYLRLLSYNYLKNIVKISNKKKICKITRFFFPNDCESIGIYTTEDTDLEGFFIRS